MSRPDDDLPPSYDEALRESAPPMPTRPPTAPASIRPPVMPPRPSSSSPSSYNVSPPSNIASPAKIPWTYPSGYYCTKCGNTGYKIKNGHSCKQCWRKFAQSVSNNSVRVVFDGYPQGYPSNYSHLGMPLMPMSPAGAPQAPGGFRPFSGSTNLPSGPSSGPPLMVQPGDPRIGGVTCGECRGKGRVRFLLDKEICTLCHGVGRVF
ncbi:LANO_0C08658g1_1 [Lachancea nothofagi CBS 11611]|uniref:LANO_0C08658g1_1 n=1 Tax=Lachancea nothofagi CBS 11611 TaxID=1266666 RepID=A0A1G4J9F8_9SACH|nr:LANO_0C08658g1_1 [Lachancea nothofagi CBS 11611]